MLISPFRVIPKLLGPLKVEPVLCHGDLWVCACSVRCGRHGAHASQSGNTGTADDGQPVIFDPSSYYGHNESEYVLHRRDKLIQVASER